MLIGTYSCNCGYTWEKEYEGMEERPVCPMCNKQLPSVLDRIDEQMRKSDTPNGKRASFHEWWKHLPSGKGRGMKGKKRSCGKSDAQLHWGSVRTVTRKYINNREWDY